MYETHIMSQIGVYYESWSEKWTDSGAKSGLASVAKPVSIVYLSFAKPDCTYVSGQNTFSGTGLSFSYDWKVLREAIRIVKQKGIVVMLSVGGGS